MNVKNTTFRINYENPTQVDIDFTERAIADTTNKIKRIKANKSNLNKKALSSLITELTEDLTRYTKILDILKQTIEDSIDSIDSIKDNIASIKQEKQARLSAKNKALSEEWSRRVKATEEKKAAFKATKRADKIALERKIAAYEKTLNPVYAKGNSSLAKNYNSVEKAMVNPYMWLFGIGRKINLVTKHTFSTMNFWFSTKRENTSLYIGHKIAKNSLINKIKLFSSVVLESIKRAVDYVSNKITAFAKKIYDFIWRLLNKLPLSVRTPLLAVFTLAGIAAVITFVPVGLIGTLIYQMYRAYKASDDIQDTWLWTVLKVFMTILLVAGFIQFGLSFTPYPLDLADALWANTFGLVSDWFSEAGAEVIPQADGLDGKIQDNASSMAVDAIDEYRTATNTEVIGQGDRIFKTLFA